MLTISALTSAARDMGFKSALKVNTNVFRILSCAVCILFTVNSVADDLVIPTSFPARSLAVLPSGHFIAGHTIGLSRFNQDGTLNLSYPYLDGAFELGIENNGRVLAYNAGIGRLDMDVGEHSPIQIPISDFILQPDGKMVVMKVNPPGAPMRHTILRINQDGSPDPSFESSLFPGSGFSGLALQEDGKFIVAAGTNGVIARFKVDGTRDESFNAPLISPAVAHSVVVQPDGKIIVGGFFESAGIPKGVLRLNSNGSVDSTFSTPEIIARIDSLALQANGKILASGIFYNSVGAQAETNIVRLNADGTLDQTFSAGSYKRVFTGPMVLLDNGSVVAGFETNLVLITNDQPATQTLAREGSSLTWLRGGSSPEISYAKFYASLDGVAWTDLGAGERIAGGGWRLTGADIPAGSRLRARGYVTGTSHHVDHVPGAPALYVQPAPERTVNFDADVMFQVTAKGAEPLSFQWFKDGEPIAGAESPTLLLTHANGGDTGVYSAIVSNSEGSSTSRVSVLTVIDPILVSQPNSVWINVGGSTNLNVAAVGTGLSYQWKKNGENIPGATSASLDFPNVTPADTAEYQVIITGTYGTLDSSIVTMRVNTILPDPNFNPNWEATTQWFPIQTAVAFNNEIFMGGLFRMIGESGQRDLVRIKVDGSIDPLFAPALSGGEINGVASMSLTPNGQLLIGGNFMTVNGEQQPYLARLNRDGSLDQTFRPVIDGVNNGVYTQVSSIEVLPDGRILIGGGFATVNDEPRSGLALLFQDGSLDESFNPDPIHAPGITWGSIVQPSGRIIAYGWDFRRFLADGTADFDFTEAVTANSFQPLPLANGNILLNSQQGLLTGPLVLLDPDGTPDLDFDGASFGTAEAEQASGQLLVAYIGHSVPIGTTNGLTIDVNTSFLLRMNFEGSEDPAFSPLFDNYSLYKAMRADGTMLIAGAFSNISGISVPKVALLKNSESATQSLTLAGGTATWLRSATSPEVLRAVFESSSDGVTWTFLGPGVRTAGGWKVDGLQLKWSGKLRARGFSRGSIYETAIDVSNTSSGGLTIVRHEALPDHVVLTATAPSAASVVIQISTDLQQWSDLLTNTMEGQSWELTLTNQTASSAFYRLLQARE